MKRPRVALLDEIERWIARVDGDGVRRPRQALAGWLAVAQDAPANDDEAIVGRHVVTPPHILERLPAEERERIREREMRRVADLEPATASVSA